MRVTAGGPLAAVEEEYVGPRRGAYNAFSAGFTTLYAPMLLRNYYGWYSAIHFHNVGGSNTTVTVHYYRSDGTEICPLDPDEVFLAANGHAELYQGSTDPSYTCLVGKPDQIFAARMTASPSVAFVAIVNQDNAGAGDFQAYNALPPVSNILVFPYIRRDDQYWYSDIVVQNTSYGLNTVTLTFYDLTTGQKQGNSVVRTLNSSGWWEFYSNIPPNFEGSAVVTGTQPIAAVGNVLNDTMTQDAGMSYSGMEKQTFNTLSLPGGSEGEGNP